MLPQLIWPWDNWMKHALDFAIAKDERLAVGFFQRAAVMMQINRLEEALSDCIWAQKHMRENIVIDYKQLGLRFKLYNWQVLYNAAAVYCRMGQWKEAREVLLSVTQEKGGDRSGNIEMALDSILRKEVLAPLLVPEEKVFRPRKQDVEQLQQRDFLGKAKVIASMIPNDDFGGFEPLRLQKPGFYEPNADGSQDSRYMHMQVPYIAKAPGQLTVPGGAIVFLFGKEDRDGMATVIYDGKRGLLPMSLLEPADIKTFKALRKNRLPSGIPLPPELKPPTRPKVHSSPTASPPVHCLSNTLPSSYTNAFHEPLSASAPAKNTANTANEQCFKSCWLCSSVIIGCETIYLLLVRIPLCSQNVQVSSVMVKVHYVYTVALPVPMDMPYNKLKKEISQKFGQPASQLRLRYRKHGSQALIPLDQELEPGCTIQELTEANRLTIWCQKEDLLANRTILYQMVALYDYSSQGPEDLEFSEGDTIDVLSKVNEEWLEGHCAGNIGIFPSCFAYRESSIN